MMSSQEYEVVFDLVRHGYQPPWFALIVGGFIILAGVGAALFARSARSRLVSILFGGVLIALAGSTVMSHWQEYNRLRGATLAGRGTVIEGVVQRFHADAVMGNGAQTFSLSGRDFAIRSHDITPSFRETVGAGGPNLSGRCVRVVLAHDEQTSQDKIVWLGIRREGCADEPNAPRFEAGPN